MKDALMDIGVGLSTILMFVAFFVLWMGAPFVGYFVYGLGFLEFIVLTFVPFPFNWAVLFFFFVP